VDGKYHQLPEQQISDEERTDWLEDKGFSVLRFTNEQIIADTDNVLNRIKDYIINEQKL
jgi:very-short-patch-repair endonuclease